MRKEDSAGNKKLSRNNIESRVDLVLSNVWDSKEILETDLDILRL